MARATAAETSDRIDDLQGMILEGEPNTACLTFARQQWGISRAQGYKLLKRAWSQIKDDVDETGIDRLELLAWSIQTLMSAAGQAKQSINSPHDPHQASSNKSSSKRCNGWRLVFSKG